MLPRQPVVRFVRTASARSGTQRDVRALRSYLGVGVDVRGAALDNITHSLIGVAVAELAQPPAPTPAERRVLMAGNVIAANLPDIDLVYTGLTPAPLGYLLHHRGYTHTIVGLIGLALLLGAALLMSPAARRLARTHPARLWAPLALNLIGHVSLDALNSYGVHPFYPFDARWYYGDAVFIFEPWLWIVLAAGAIRNATTRRTQWLTGGAVAALLVTLAALGVVPASAILVLAVTGSLLMTLIRHLGPRARSAVALSTAILFIVAMLGLSRAARAQTVAVIEQDPRGDIVDVILSPDPGVPVCWTVITIEQARPAGEIVLRRGTLSIAPRWHPQSDCLSRQFTGGSPAPAAADGLAWSEEIRQPIARLRTLDDTNCRVRAWLQFGRAPVVRGDRILDLRFETGGRGNFTAMRINAGSAGDGCPAHVPPWAPPRADVLGPAR